LQSGDGDIQVMNAKASEHLEVTVAWREPLVKIVQQCSGTYSQRTATSLPTAYRARVNRKALNAMLSVDTHIR
jgi:hypothetical protein